MFGLTPKQLDAIPFGTKRHAMALRILQFVAPKNGATCDECMIALRLPHQSASARYHELVRVGCLVRTGKKRRTQSGSLAWVHRDSSNADFTKFLNQTTTKRKRLTGLTMVEQGVLSAGLKFIASWNRCKTPKGREEAAVSIVNRLAKLAQTSSPPV